MTSDANWLLDLPPDVVRLAESISLAVRVEPALLRAARLRLSPSMSAAAEADLWFSGLVETRNRRSFVLLREARRVLQHRLADRPRDLVRAWQVVRHAHNNAPQLMRIEEELTWLAVSGAPDAAIADLLDTIIATMAREEERSRGLAQWTVRAIPRLPHRVCRFDQIWALAIASSARLGGRRIRPDGPPPARLGDWLPIVLPRNAQRIPVGVQLVPDGVELSEPPANPDRTLWTPATNPIVLELVSPGTLQRPLPVVLERGRTTVIGAPASALRLRTVTGDEYAVTTAPIAPQPRIPVPAMPVNKLDVPVYLAGVTPESARRLAEVNAAGVAALRRYLASDEAVAFVGAGASAPLYPLRQAMIAELIDAGVEWGLGPDEAATCRELATEQPDAAVELLRQGLGTVQYQAALRRVFRVRRDPETGRTWTPTQELVCRCTFKAVVTTNYDPGIVDARIRVRPQASGTGFASWTDELALDRWRTGEVFGDDELPVLFAHGHHNQPDAMVLAATEYRRAYAGKLSRVLATMIDAWHLVWIGFNFTDQRISGVLREVAEHSGTRLEPGGVARHVAIMAWDPNGGRDPETLRPLARIQYGADLILYPAPDGDHSALQALLAEFTVPKFPPVMAPAIVAARDPAPEIPVRWVPAPDVVKHFTGRVEELARLDRWAADPTVRLVGLTAWGGAGKSALVTHWIQQHGGVGARPGTRGVFGWSFYADASAEHWAQAVLEWAGRELGVRIAGSGRLGTAVLALLQRVPLMLVLDGLEVLQEGPEDGQLGRLLDGTLREVLTGACRLQHDGLVVLTSRFAFADLKTFDGGAARMLDVPPFTPAEGAALLAAVGGAWLPEDERRNLVAGVDGHALTVSVLGGVLAGRPPTADLTRLCTELAAATGTHARVALVLRFNADRLDDADRYLVAAVALFAHPVTSDAVLTVAAHPTFGGQLDGWTPQRTEHAAKHRLASLLSWHPGGMLSAHPLVRDTFRPLALGAAQVAAETTLTGIPAGTITNREDGLRVVEAIELFLDADHWQAAHDLYHNRTNDGRIWLNLPAARLGQRAASAFVATPARRRDCLDRLTPQHLSFYLNEVGLFAMNSGDLTTACEYLNEGISHNRAAADLKNESVVLQNLSECLAYLGEIDDGLLAAAHAAARAAEANVREVTCKAVGHRGWLMMLAGDTAAAEEQFASADRIRRTDSPDEDHLYSSAGVWWGTFLARTGRTGPALRLTDRNRAACVKNGWNADVARCDRLLGQLALLRADTATAAPRLAAASQTFRDGDYLVELAETLPMLAECARRTGGLDAAQQHAIEAIAIAAPRQLRPAHATALTVRAKIDADRATAGSPDHLQRGRDAADAALRIAAGRRLAWHEMDALEAHAHLDNVEGTDHGWATKAASLRKHLILDSLDPDPPATVERLVANERIKDVR